MVVVIAATAAAAVLVLVLAEIVVCELSLGSCQGHIYNSDDEIFFLVYGGLANIA